MESLITRDFGWSRLFKLSDDDEIPFSYDIRNCNMFCLSIIAMDLVAFTHHLVVNIGYLHLWANFNVLLMSNTIYTAYLTTRSLLLLIRASSWLYASYRTRLFTFIASLISTTIFFGHVIGVLNKIYLSVFKKTVNLRSIFNILSIYTLVLEVGSVLPAIHIFLYEGLALDSTSIFNPKWGWWIQAKDSEAYHLRSGDEGVD